ncbi:hypothetical protein BDD43_3412 [Mucilaginibacter gracilis]|uniref:Uncharacterized protein n=1 Tax=Mucilaginibacter gracilis TaxID=423350 RepID=A0A495J2L5_9SPHI|nr:hypothetical protein [Mucilaginibacter gracilis]RKR83210.1 hypothetical protein BDD43_3412 [Mucilaginibacter gracilis]
MKNTPTSSDRKRLTYADLLEFKQKMESAKITPQDWPGNAVVYEAKDVPGLYRVAYPMPRRKFVFCPACDMEKRGAKGLLMIPHNCNVYE